MKTPDEIKRGLECGDCKSCPYSERNSNDGDNHCGEIDGDALAYIQQLEARNTRKALPMWVCVEERMPKTFENVLVFTAEKEYLLCHYDGDEWIVNYDGECAGYDYTITHWMTLPEPPKEE